MVHSLDSVESETIAAPTRGAAMVSFSTLSRLCTMIPSHSA